MKSRDMSKGFRTRQVTNILYSAVITCLLEVFQASAYYRREGAQGIARRIPAACG